jgi:hypothetical protein
MANLSETDYTKFVKLLEELSTKLDDLSSQLQVYDKALRFGESNNPSIVLTFRGWMEIVQISGLPDFSSPAHKATIQRLLELAAGVFQASSIQQKPEKL